MIAALTIVCWLSLAVVLAVYVGYPLSLVVLGRLAGRRHDTAAITPSVTLIISAYNEAAVIADKLANALALDYPSDQLEVLVVSDASDDGTDQIVADCSDPRVRLFRQHERQGKSLGLTRAVPTARGEILVFSDANSMYDRQALGKLVRHFADQAVGYVVGLQGYLDQTGSAVVASESLYWRYETWLKLHESRFRSVVGGDGAIYAIRAALFTPLRHDDISDFVNPLQIAARGYRGIFDPEALCYEHTADTFQGEFRRKVRIVNRSLRGLSRVPATLWPPRVGWFAYEVWWHKLLRWLVPFFLVLLLGSSLALAVGQGGLVYPTLVGGQVAFYLLAALRMVPVVRNWKPVYIAYYFCLVNVAAAWGVLTMLAGRRFVTWTPIRVEPARSAER